jgi:CD109 antigen
MNTKYGIGLAETPSNITTSLPLFLVVDTPYEVKRNETITLDIAVFYRLNVNQTVTISIPKLPYYTATSLTTYGWTSTTTSYVKSYRAIANKNFKVQIALKFLTVGNAAIKITAASALAGDAIQKVIRIVFEGIERTITSTAALMLNDPSQPFDADLLCKYPPGTYPDSKTVTATVTGDIFGTALQNLEQLIKIPGGCCEQNLVKLVPNIAIYKYLEATDRFTPELQADLINKIQLGVQNELGCQRDDGGFSFYSGQTSSSTWLTAYIVRAFIIVNEIIPNQVADSILIPAITFLKDRQNPSDGSFNELGPIYHISLQGGTGQGIALDAYVIETLRYATNAYSDPSYAWIYNSYIGGINFLISRVQPTNTVTDVYDLAMVTFALKNAGEDVAAQIPFDDFYGFKIELPSELKMHWQKSLTNNYYTSSLDVEVSSYGLELMMLYGYQTDAFKVVRWLVSQANEFGGYASTQDTVVALLALSEFAIIYVTDPVVDLTLTPNVGPVITDCDIDATNALTLQVFPLNPLADTLHVEASPSSSGYAIVSLICNFYQDPAQVVQSFKITYQFYRQCRYSIGFNVCATRIPQGKSGMALIRVKMPSGFRYEQWWGDSGNDNVSRTEVSNGGTLVTFYVNSIGNTASCVKVNAYRYSTLTQLKGGTIIVNDYYDTCELILSFS